MDAGIILGGGLGKRLGGDLPKQFLKLADKEIIRYSIEKFADAVDVIVLVIHNDWLDYAKEHLDYPIIFVAGGKTRQLSVYNALTVLTSNTSWNWITEASFLMWSKLGEIIIFFIAFSLLMAIIFLIYKATKSKNNSRKLYKQYKAIKDPRKQARFWGKYNKQLRKYSTYK